MRMNLRATFHVGLALGTILVGAACNQEEVAWETTTGAVGANMTDQQTFDERWRSYRLGVVSGLDVMSRSLDNARREATVADRSEVDGLTARVDRLRSDMVAEIDEPRASANTRRAELESSFGDLRNDVEALLIRLGHDREEFAAWQGID